MRFVFHINLAIFLRLQHFLKLPLSASKSYQRNRPFQGFGAILVEGGGQGKHGKIYSKCKERKPIKFEKFTLTQKAAN